MYLQYSKSASPAWRVCMAALVAVLVLTLFQFGAQRVNAASANGKVIVGYWHNFDNGSTNIKLRDISPAFDIVQVAFAEPVGGSHTGNMVFTPYNATVSEFQADVDFLQSRGQKVLISIGGANGTLELTTATGKQNFVNTMKSIIDTYGFNGFDIDLEGSSLALNAGDTDFKNPTTPKITNLIAASQEILASYGPDFMLTMAPETAYVQGGASSYGGPWGAYLPVIYNLRNQLDYLHVQHYNSGSMMGLDGRSYSQGTPDFHVAMAEMLLQGFPVGNNPNNMFPALRADQIVIGLPASPQAAGGGYTTPANVHKALDYLIKGVSYGGSYVLRNPAGYPALSGVMTWSINWDKYINYEFSSSHRAYLDALGTIGGNDTSAPTVPTGLQSTGKTTTSVNLSWNASTDNVGVTGYIVSYGSSSVTVSGTTAAVTGLTPNTAYSFTVKARDAAGNQSAASAPVTVTTNAPTVDTVAPSVPAGFQSTGKTASSVTLSWSASTDNVGVTGYTVSYGSANLYATGTSLTVNGLSASTAYTFTVKAYDAAGNVSAASSPVTVTTNAPSTCTAPAWNAATAYGGGARVSYNATVYESKWWTQGDQPNLSGQWGVWKVIGPCGGVSNPDTAAPTAPTGLSATGSTTSSISLSWGASTDNVGVSGYTVYYGSSSVNVSGTSAAISGLTAATSYTFTVKARDAAGNLSAASNSLQASTQQGSTGTTTWAAGVSYQAGNSVTYNGVSYVCLQSHTSLVGWEPPNVAALWKAQ